jgi:hypothetical protein
MDEIAKPLKKQRSYGFQPELAEKLMADNAEDIIQATIDAAKNGDGVAMRLCVERLVPLRKRVPAPIELPNADSLPGVTEALGVIVAAVAKGALDLESGSSLAALVEAKARAIETNEALKLEQRIASLESQADRGRE